MLILRDHFPRMSHSCISVIERKMDMVARVAMNEATLPRVMTSPFIAPNTPPRAMAEETAIATAHQPSPAPLMIMMDSTPTKATSLTYGQIDAAGDDDECHAQGDNTGIRKPVLIRW